MLDKDFRKNFLWNMIGTTLNSFNSMFFMVAITRINGESDAGVYTLLFAVACLLYNIGIYTGRTFQVTDKTGEINDTEYVIHRLITVALMLVIGIGYCIVKQLDTYKWVLMIALTFMKCIEAFSDVLYGIEQKNDELYKSGISYTLKAICSLIVIIIVDLIIHNLALAFIIVDVIVSLITIVYDIPSVVKYLDKKYEVKNVLKLFGTGFFAFAFYFLSAYFANATKYALDGRVTSAEQAKYSIILMPATLIALCAIYLLQPYINQLSNYYAENNVEKFRKSLRMISLGIVGIGGLALIAATILGIPVLNLVYGIDLSNYLFSLQVIIVGATIAAIITVLSTAMTTFRNTKAQFYIYLIVCVAIYFISGKMVDLFGTNGAAYSYFIGILMQFLLYYIMYRKELGKWMNKQK